MHLPCLVVYLNDYRIKIAVNYHHLNLFFINETRINTCLESFNVVVCFFVGKYVVGAQDLTLLSVHKGSLSETV